MTAVAVETATQSERINTACREAYGILRAAFNDKLIECGFTKSKADELATFIVSAIEGEINLSRTIQESKFSFANGWHRSVAKKFQSIAAMNHYGGEVLDRRPLISRVINSGEL